MKPPNLLFFFRSRDYSLGLQLGPSSTKGKVIAGLVVATCSAVAQYMMSKVFQIKDPNPSQESIKTEAKESRGLGPTLHEVGSSLADPFVEGESVLHTGIRYLGIAACLVAVRLYEIYGPNSSGEKEPDKNHGNELPRDNIYHFASKVGHAVVHISLAGEELNGNYTTATGSGIIFNEYGFILTCAHVVANKKDDKVIVSLQDHQTFEGTVITVWENYNIAIVKIDAHFKLKTAKFSSGLSLGGWVVAMGSPKPHQSSLTLCRVSLVNHKCKECDLVHGRSYLMTNVSTSVENIGGPILNTKGKVVGINVQEVSHARSLSIVLPFDGTIINAIDRFVIKWEAQASQLLILTMVHQEEDNIPQIRDNNLEFVDDKKRVEIAEIMDMMINDKKPSQQVLSRSVTKVWDSATLNALKKEGHLYYKSVENSTFNSDGDSRSS